MIEFLKDLLAYMRETNAPGYVIVGVLSFGVIAWAMWRVGLASKQGIAAIRAQYKGNLEELERRHARLTDERDSCERRMAERDIRIGELESRIHSLQQQLTDQQALLDVMRGLL